MEPGELVKFADGSGTQERKALGQQVAVAALHGQRRLEPSADPAAVGDAHRDRCKRHDRVRLNRWARSFTRAHQGKCGGQESKGAHELKFHWNADRPSTRIAPKGYERGKGHG